MNCFVIQNVNSTNKYILKSQRLRYLIFFLSKYTYSLFLKFYLISNTFGALNFPINSTLKTLYEGIYFRYMFRVKRRYSFSNMSTISSNLTRGYSYKFLKTLVNYLTNEDLTLRAQTPLLNKLYFKPIRAVLFPFQKKKLNIIVLFLIHMAHLNSFSYSSGFTITHSFIFILNIFKFYTLNHLYYLKHRHF